MVPSFSLLHQRFYVQKRGNFEPYPDLTGNPLNWRHCLKDDYDEIAVAEEAFDVICKQYSSCYPRSFGMLSACLFIDDVRRDMEASIQMCYGIYLLDFITWCCICYYQPLVLVNCSPSGHTCIPMFLVGPHALSISVDSLVQLLSMPAFYEKKIVCA